MVVPTLPPQLSLAQNEPPSAGDFRSFLQCELTSRCRKRPSYSLRAFARQLEIEPSALSKILAGKRAITPAMFEKLSRKLELAPDQIEKLKPAPASESLATAVYRDVTLDLFQVISDWYHYAILELTQVRGFRPHPKWIARSLGISVSEVNIAVERLVRIGFLEIDRKGRWKDRSGSVTTVGNAFTATAFRKLQRHVLEKAIVALETVPMEERDQSSMTMAVNSKNLPKAKEKIKRFRRELTALLKAGPRDQVFHLGVSLYPVSGKHPEKESGKGEVL